MVFSAAKIFILFVAVIFLFDSNVTSEEVGQENDTSHLTHTRNRFRQLAMPRARKHPKIVVTTTDDPEMPDLGSRYGVIAPPAQLIECKDNEKYQEGSCKEQSSQ